MTLSLAYLKNRHDYWKNEIGKAGIWDPAKFGAVYFLIRRKSKSYNGLFHRKWVLVNNVRTRVDRIIIYNNLEEFNSKYIDSVLVHEMIHQYIFQTSIKDTGKHGKVFKDFMSKINRCFPDDLKIEITGTNPLKDLSGPGSETHTILLLTSKEADYCCVVYPNRINYFEKEAKKYKKAGVINDYVWMKSNDVFFGNFRRCKTSLHGKKLLHDDMLKFLKDHNVTKL